MIRYFLLFFLIITILFTSSCKKELNLTTYGKVDEPGKMSENVLSWTFKGLDKAGMKNYPEALKCFDKALELNPDCVYTLNCKGLTLLSSGEAEEGIKLFHKAIEINPAYMASYFNKGNAFIAMKKYEEAISCFDNILQVSPKNPGAWNSKGVIFMDIYNDYGKATECFDKAIEIDPSYGPALINKKNTLKKQEKDNQATPAL